jgi:hypothetical protein
MTKLEQVYKSFLEELSRPEKRKQELNKEWRKFSELEEQTKQAFSEAEAKGEPSNELFDDYQKAIKNRELTEAKLAVIVKPDIKKVTALASELKDVAYAEYQRLQALHTDKVKEAIKERDKYMDTIEDIVKIRNEIQHTKKLLINEAKHYTPLPSEFRATHFDPLYLLYVDSNNLERYRIERKSKGTK